MDTIHIEHGKYSCRYTIPTGKCCDPDWKPEEPVDSSTLEYVPGWAMLHYSSNRSQVEFYHDEELLFTLQPEYCKVDSPGVVFHTLDTDEFPKLTERQRTLCTIHLKYNELAVYNMDGIHIQNTFKGRGMISRMIDADSWIIMLSWEWNPIAFMGIIKKDDFFRDIQNSSNDDLEPPKLSGFITVKQMVQKPKADLVEMMRTIGAQITADPSERNRTGLCVDDSYGFDFYYDRTGIYLKEGQAFIDNNVQYVDERYFPFDKLYSGEFDLDMDPNTEPEPESESKSKSETDEPNEPNGPDGQDKE